MSEKWWRKLFGEEELDRPDSEEHLPSLKPFSQSAVGRFADTNRNAKVKMKSTYPTVSKANKDSDGADRPKRVPPLNERIEKEQDRSKQKPKFRVSRIPSPVFGYQKPPAGFYRGDDYFLDPDKENRERKQIDTTRAEERMKRVPGVPKRADGPELEPAVLEQPALSRQTNQPEAQERRDEQENGQGDSVQDTPGQAEHRQQSGDHDADRTDGQAREVIPIHSSLPRASGRPHGRSVPFNVLMFHSDRIKRSDSSQQRPDGRGTETAGELLLPLHLLDDPPATGGDDQAWLADKQQTLAATLDSFHVRADLIGYVQGPSVTRFDIRLQPGVKVSKVLRLSEDIKLGLAARQIRIAPVPGKRAIGIEVPNRVRRPVVLKEIVRSPTFRDSRAPLTAALGQDVGGDQVVVDLAKMPHGLIAGATGSGKSVCIHSIIISLIYRLTPNRLRLLLIDPKVVELAPYRKLPHLAAPVITEPKQAALALKWAVDEMERRYRCFADSGVRNIDGFNDKKANGEQLPYLVIIIDELADLMMASPQDVEDAVCRIAQKARAAGIHLLLATQRPSVDVITGLIKANIPTRIAFSVSSQNDSRTILDGGGAERLLGRGDLLFAASGARSVRRLQGCYVSEAEIARVTDAFERADKPGYLFSTDDLKISASETSGEDELLEEAALFVVEAGQASVSAIQRHFRVGYNRAARLVDELEERHVVSGPSGSKPRQVLVTKEDLKGQIAGNT
jgi:S-DNA-T family DNA segregation ATPase FtsK/SpoIIIE